MLKISKQNRDEIVKYLQSAVVSAHVGANLVAISNALLALEEVKEEVKPTEEAK